MMTRQNQQSVSTARLTSISHSRSRRGRSLLAQCALLAPMSAAILAAGANRAAQAADFFVSPTGSSTASGSVTRPWNLQTALNHPSSIRPGDTIYMRGGVYKGRFISKLKGTAAQPITVRSYPGEWATIDRDSIEKLPTIAVMGSHVIFYDFEVTNSTSGRTYRPGDVLHDYEGAMGFNVRAPYTRFINLVIHDQTSHGIGLWEEAADSEVYGCLIYNNGVDSFDHGIYTRGKSSNAKLIRDNIIFNNAGNGISMHASGNKTTVEGYQVEGNVLSNNGLFETNGRNWVVGTATNVLERVRIVNNFTYQNNADVNVQLRYRSPGKSVLFQDNYLAGGAIRSLNNSPAVTKGNRLVGRKAKLESRNRKKLEDEQAVAEAEQEQADPKWQDSALVPQPHGVDVFVRQNKYAPSRANIVIYNWEKRDTVNVDVKNVVAIGAKYEVRNAQDFLGKPVLRGTYDGKSLHIPMKNLAVAKPVDTHSASSQLTGPEFGVFVLLSR